MRNRIEDPVLLDLYLLTKNLLQSSKIKTFVKNKGYTKPKAKKNCGIDILKIDDPTFSPTKMIISQCEVISVFALMYLNYLCTLVLADKLIDMRQENRDLFNNISLFGNMAIGVLIAIDFNRNGYPFMHYLDRTQSQEEILWRNNEVLDLLYAFLEKKCAVKINNMDDFRCPYTNLIMMQPVCLIDPKEGKPKFCDLKFLTKWVSQSNKPKNPATNMPFDGKFLSTLRKEPEKLIDRKLQEQIIDSIVKAIPLYLLPKNNKAKKPQFFSKTENINTTSDARKNSLDFE